MSKVSFDFDNTLRNHDGTDILPTHEKLKAHLSDGDKVIVVTRRHPDDTHSGFDGDDVTNYVKEKFGNIPIIFDDSDLKYKTLDKEGVEKHYDDDKREIDALHRFTDIEGVLVTDGKGMDVKSQKKAPEKKEKSDDNNLSTKVALVYDTGLNFEFAERLAKDFKKVYFFADYEGHQFENTNEMEVGLIGNGTGKVEKIYDFEKVKDEVHLFVFPDCKYAGVQCDLEKQGKRVWGGRHGIELETERYETKNKMKELGLPIKKYWKIIGIEKFRQFLKEHNDLYIKTDVSRGDFESFHHENYYLTEPRLDDLKSKIGPLADIYEFIAEEPVSSDDEKNPVIEAGEDMLSIDGQFPDEILLGYELKDSFYCGVVTKRKNLPSFVTDTTNKLAPLLKKERYRNFFSTEVRVKNKVGYPIDLTLRIPSPPGDIYYMNIENFSEVVWYGAAGILVQPKYKCKFAAEAIIHSSRCLSGQWEAIQFPEKFKENVRIKNKYYDKVKDTYYSIPLYEGLGEIGSVCYIDDNFDKCIKGLKEVADAVKGTAIHINVGDASKAEKVIEQGGKIGIKFF
jgi:hypothetical protein